MGKSTGIRYLLERRGRYFVRVRVPKDVAHVFGGPFIETFLQTSDKGEARERVPGAVAEIFSRFARRRQGGAPTREELTYEGKVEAKRQMTAMVEAGGPFMIPLEDPNTRAVAILGRLGLPADEQNVTIMAQELARRDQATIERYDRRMPAEEPGERPAPRQGSPEALGGRLDAWLEQKRTKRGQRLAPSGQEIARLAIGRLAEKFPRVEDVSREAVETWCREMVDKGYDPATVRRLLPLWRDYWRFLKVPGASPFDGLKLASAGESDREGFTRDEVVALLTAAKDDARLHATIMIGAYTGMRLGEIMALRVGHVDLRAGTLRIVEGKTDAARRTIPIHPMLMPLLTELASPKYEFIISGLEGWKQKSKCDRLSHDFGDLKTKLGHDEHKVFHSLRRTVDTMLHRAKPPIRDNVIDEIMGWRRPKTMRRHYLDEASPDEKREAIEKLIYPGA